MMRRWPALLALAAALPALAQEARQAPAAEAAPEAAPEPKPAAPKPAAPKPVAPPAPGAPAKPALPAPGASNKPALPAPGASNKPALPAPGASNKPALPAPGKGPTPNAERQVAIGAINKRTGETRTYTGHPGQGFDFGSLHVTVRACEQTPPWEQKLTGAFLLIDERLANGTKKRVYSGWMFAESPSLHPLEHPRYDIWVKSCTMRWPETGPDTVVAGKGDSGSASKRSSAKKSPETPKAEPN
jgi:hypothetical protein